VPSRFPALRKLAAQVFTYATLKRVAWLEEGRLAACRYPRSESALRELTTHGVTLLVNLHERPHPQTTLPRHGLSQLHLPFEDFTPPTPAQLDTGVAAIEQALADGKTVAVHCGAGLGRTGTLLACYLVKRGLAADAAIARVRTARPGSIETAQQELAVQHYARRQPSAAPGA
jgi:atypical dual specificity phosphatase